MNIVEVYEDELRVSHRVIAEQTDNKIKSVNNLITENIKDLEEFGRVRFKIATLKTNGGMQETKTYYLNEPQATLLITFMRNNEIVKKFKVLIVKEFYKMKDYIKNKNYLPQANDRTSATIYCVNNAIEILKVNEASKILMLEKAYRSLRVDTSFLPKSTKGVKNEFNYKKL
jgi:phage regulator Rha-like protein